MCLYPDNMYELFDEMILLYTSLSQRQHRMWINGALVLLLATTDCVFMKLPHFLHCNVHKVPWDNSKIISNIRFRTKCRNCFSSRSYRPLSLECTCLHRMQMCVCVSVRGFAIKWQYCLHFFNCVIRSNMLSIKFSGHTEPNESW